MANAAAKPAGRHGLRLLGLLLGGLCWLPGMVMAGSFYLGVQGGVSIHRNTTFNQGENNETRVIANYRDSGETASVVFGRAGPERGNFRGRVELELGHQSSDVSTMTFDDTDQAAPVEDDSDLDFSDGDSSSDDQEEREEGERFTVTNALGETSATFAFVSAYGDFNLWRRVDGILGLGLGVGEIEFSGHRAGAEGLVMNHKATAIGYHLAIGLGWRVTSFLDLEATYRQRSWEDVRLRAQDGSSSRVRVPSHNMQLGLRLLF
ncbi:MAG: hypothetical protein EA349_00510 [Halomonadaceae bacterium]|nr:MAG: hypothetical protein EA349_00510 [Halomonadaceae bacterium]